MKPQTLAHQIEPASCSKSVIVRNRTAQNLLEVAHGLVAEEKFDGNRYLLQYRPNGSRHNYLTSRRISKQTGLFCEKQDKQPRMKNWAWVSGFEDTVFDGEIVPEAGISSDAQHDMALGKGHYHCWDILRYKGKDTTSWPAYKRRRLLESLVSALPSWMTVVPQSLRPVALLAAVFAKKGEGIILKDPNAPYGEGWTKVKSEESHDCIFVGVEFSTEGKYAKNDWIKNVVLAQFCDAKHRHFAKNAIPRPLYIEQKRGYVLVNVGKTSGMDETTRAAITKNWKTMLGSVVEVDSERRLPSGKFRHPRFVRFRDDKSAEQCVMRPIKEV